MMMQVKRPRSQPAVVTSTCQHEQTQGTGDHSHVIFRELVDRFHIYAPLLAGEHGGLSFLVFCFASGITKRGHLYVEHELSNTRRTHGNTIYSQGSLVIVRVIEPWH